MWRTASDRCESSPIQAQLEEDNRDLFKDSCAALEGRRKGCAEPAIHRHYSARCRALASWFQNPALLPKSPPTKKVA